MMISTRGRYALRILVDLAENQNGGYITLKEAADRQEISEKYLESIVKDLVKARFDITGAGNMKLLKTPAIDWPDRQTRSMSWRSCNRRTERLFRSPASRREASPAPVPLRAEPCPSGRGWIRSSANTSAALPCGIWQKTKYHNECILKELPGSV